MAEASAPARPLVRPSSWRQFKAILRKDIVMELRTFEMLTSMGLYTLLTLVIYQIALSQSGSSFEVRQIAAGLLWLAFVFTSMLGLNRSLVHEKDQGCLEALLLSPVDRPVIFFAKAVGNLIFLLIVQVITIPLFFVMFLSKPSTLKAPVFGEWWMVPLALLVGAIGIAGIGTLLATISVNTRGRDFILAVLFIPIMFPLLLAVVGATAVAMNGAFDPSVFWNDIALAGGYDAIMLLAAYGLYEFVISA
jgi:heme exporter protein B